MEGTDQEERHQREDHQMAFHDQPGEVRLLLAEEIQMGGTE
jgi:hypothetical protein